MPNTTYTSLNIRTFIGAKNFSESRAFYTQLGFEEVIIDKKMSLFKVNETMSFYLQDYYVKDWINNSMVFLEVDNLDTCWSDLESRNLKSQFPKVRLSRIKTFEWGRECYLHDPSGVLWHFGQFITR